MKQFRLSTLKGLLLFVMLSVAGLAHADTFQSGTPLYVKFNSGWEDAKSEAKHILEFYVNGKGSAGYVELTPVTGVDKLYVAAVPDEKNNWGGWTHVNVRRVNPSDMSNKYNAFDEIPASSSNNTIELKDNIWDGKGSDSVNRSNSTTPKDYYIHSSIFDASWSDTKLEKSDNKYVVTIDFDNKLDGDREFGIMPTVAGTKVQDKDNGGYNWYAADGSVTLDAVNEKAYDLKGGGTNFTVPGTMKGKWVFEMTHDGNKPTKLTVRPESEETTHNYTFYFNYGIPDDDGSSWANPLQITPGEEFTLGDLNGKKFSIKRTGTDNSETYYNIGSNVSVDADNAPHDWAFNQEGDYQFTLDGQYKFKLNVGNDNVPVSITITAPAKEIENAKDIYVIGNVIDSNWTEGTGGIKMKLLGGSKYIATVELKDNNGKSYFRFYNDTDKNEFGPSSDGSEPSTTSSNSNTNVNTWNPKSAWKIDSGNYTIVFDADNNTFTIDKAFYIVGADLSGFEGVSDGWDNTTDGNGIYVGRTIKIAGSQKERSFAFKCDEKQYSSESGNVTISNGDYTGAYDKWNVFNVPALGEFEITITDIKPGQSVSFTAKKTGEIEFEPGDYYFVGDINDWFSVEFSNAKYKEENGKLVEDANGYYVLAEQGMNADGKEKFKKERDAYKFEYVKDGPYKGWYKFANFPNGLLSGQFQITGPDGWDNKEEVYSHIQGIYNPETTDKKGTTPKFDDYKKYYVKPIKREEITGEGDEDVSLHAYMKRGNGQNFHLQCNAVENAVIYFKPGDDKSCDMMIKGKAVDYYIFYAMRPTDGNQIGENTVNVQTLANKPNVNNYFLPGIKFHGHGENKPLPSPKFKKNGDLDLTAGGDGQNWVEKNVAEAFTEDNKMSSHMNMASGIDLEYINLDDDEAESKLKAVINDEKIVSDIIKDNLLPNGRKIPSENGHYIYVTKIPSGFENPAGYKYNMHFTKKINSAHNSEYTLQTAHMYFLPQSDNNFHVHVNKDKLEQEFSGYDIDVYYRVYRVKNVNENDYNGYATCVVDHDTQTNGHRDIMIHNPAQSDYQMKPTHEYDVNHQARTLGWSKLDEKDYESNWIKNLSFGDENYPHNHIGIDQWHYHYNGTATSWESDKRHHIELEYDKAYVQFKIVYTPKNRSNGPARAGGYLHEDGTYEVFMPAQLDTKTDEEHTRIDGGDVYKVFDNTDIATGIEDILDWEDEDFDGEVEGENAAPVYYNLQGVRVANPTKGLYIKVTGSKSEKVMF